MKTPPIRVAFLAVLAFLLSSCSSAKVGVIGRTSLAERGVRTIAMAPGGEQSFTDALSGEIAARGLTVKEPAWTADTASKLGISKAELELPDGLMKFKASGADAVVWITAIMAYDGKPESATVRVKSTADGSLLKTIEWNNGWGGLAGSPADRIQRKNIRAAAKQTCEALLK